MSRKRRKEEGGYTGRTWKGWREGGTDIGEKFTVLGTVYCVYSRLYQSYSTYNVFGFVDYLVDYRNVLN